jgi:YVTN family beta-propeller protein
VTYKPQLRRSLPLGGALAGALLTGVMLITSPVLAQDQSFRVVVVSESGDKASWLKPQGTTLVLDRVVPIGVMPTDIDGPHNVVIAPDGRGYYISVAHGTPFGSLWKLDMGSDSVLGKAQVELFPTTISLTPDGQLAFVANSDFHGDHPRTNVVSVIHTPTMTKITDLDACDMPHGVKVNHAGTRVYISCMHSDEILELEVATLTLTRRASTGPAPSRAAAAAPQHATASHGTMAAASKCSPTYVSVSTDDARLFVACNSGNTLQVWDARTFRRLKEIPVGKGAYNVEPSPDGKLVLVTNKKDQSVSLIDAAALIEIARVPTSKRIVHGVAFSPDSRLAYVTCESIGIDPGAVDVIDLRARKRLSTLPISGQPTGISIRSTPSSPTPRP